MAHKYDNFADAFEALIHYWETSQTYIETGLTEQGLGLMDWAMGKDHDAIGHLCTAVYWSLMSTRALAQLAASASDQSELMESIYWSASGAEPSEVTMDAVLLAMLTAQPDELKRFIGLVDAYRSALWNEPFNAAFYAALARGFMA